MSADRPLRAPKANGAVLADPPLGEAGTLLQANRKMFEGQHLGPHLHWAALADLRRLARQTALSAACDYLGREKEPIPVLGPTAADALLVAGHQPELFHPGVWAKNFALHGLARAHSLTPLNLVIDSDTLKNPALHVPVPTAAAGQDELPRVTRVPFDRWTGDVPYEERPVVDPSLFASFADRVSGLMAPWPSEPLLRRFWPAVLRRLKQVPLLGNCLTGTRREWERSWGCHNLEVPMSALAATPPFHWFAAHLLADLPRFHAVYNSAVRDYRVRNGIRSRQHPVPDLAADGDWFECPFWGWRAGQARRGRLLVRRGPDALELRTDSERWPSLPLGNPIALPPLAARFGELEAKGFKVRSRALTTTLFARFFLADLFVHGIGGGKYDALTDELIRRFYGCEPPAFLVLSATLWLPVEHVPAAQLASRKSRLARQCRDLHWNPQRHLDGADPSLASLAAEKVAWIKNKAETRGERRARFAALRRLTEELRPAVAGHELLVSEELLDLDKELASAAVLEKRDYSFCLYPATALRPFVSQFLALGGPETPHTRRGN